ncbi:methyltransferase [Nocardiopsis ansamitocini]|uniref:Methyltransferase n=1 Tax=Nocardiopsis ansamitocini TaxID=1670832 RepID=A0A9W6P999_9ACTN|nr:methyltransferase [Nocardiopsis ansamitocini]
MEGLDPAEIDADPLKAATRLRADPALAKSHWDVPTTELVNAALTQARLRGRAKEKFGPAADRMFFTPNGLEQATRAPVARHRAGRFAARLGPGGEPPVGDLCCGIGADLIAMAEEGLAVEGVDLDPFTLTVAQANIEAMGLTGLARVRAGDASAVAPEDYSAVFCDPARRGARGRIFNPHAYSPSWDTVTRLAETAPAACVKAAPGIPHDLVPKEVSAEWISVDWEVKEAALWFGGLVEESGPTRSATLIRTKGATPGTTTLTADPDLGAPEVSAPRGYLYEPDGAVVRSHLVAEAARAVDGALIDPAIAYITSDRLVRTPLCRAYVVHEVTPFSLKRLRAALRERDAGKITIKKRGSAVDVDKLRRDLKASGPESAVVVLTRIGDRPFYLLCSEVSGDA